MIILKILGLILMVMLSGFFTIIGWQMVKEEIKDDWVQALIGAAGFVMGLAVLTGVVLLFIEWIL